MFGILLVWGPNCQKHCERVLCNKARMEKKINKTEHTMRLSSTIKACQMHATFQCNTLRLHCPQPVAHVWPPCSYMLQHVGWCWVKFENGLSTDFCYNTFGCCKMLYAFGQLLVNNVARCCVEMLCAFDWALRLIPADFSHQAYDSQHCDHSTSYL